MDWYYRSLGPAFLITEAFVLSFVVLGLGVIVAFICRLAAGVGCNRIRLRNLAPYDPRFRLGQRGGTDRFGNADGVAVPQIGSSGDSALLGMVAVVMSDGARLVLDS